MSGDRWVLAQGYLVDGRYVLVRVIGTGGMGAVYEAWDSRIERPVAIKFLDPDLVSDRTSIERFQREALVAGRIGHENICDVRDRGVCGEGIPYIVMELLKGRTLFELMFQEKSLPAERVVPVMLEVLAALGAAHQVGIVHRDLKPENIFLTQTADGKGKVKLLDFGVSKFLDDASMLRLTKTGTALGTPWYMSPEQALGKKDVDRRSDLWSVGVVMYEALTGQLPFKASNHSELLLQVIKESPASLREIKASISRELDAVVMKAMSKDREDRFTDADAFSRALRSAVPSTVDLP
jgi:serine/threonine-protein kinase